MTSPIETTSIKQPLPSTLEANSNIQSNIGQSSNRKFNRPNTGIVQPPVISRTPMADTMEIKKQELPQTKISLIPQPKIKGNFQQLASIVTVVSGLLAFILRK